jgi:hypothetical protein
VHPINIAAHTIASTTPHGAASILPQFSLGNRSARVKSLPYPYHLPPLFNSWFARRRCRERRPAKNIHLHLGGVD